MDIFRRKTIHHSTGEVAEIITEFIQHSQGVKSTKKSSIEKAQLGVSIAMFSCFTLAIISAALTNIWPSSSLVYFSWIMVGISQLLALLNQFSIVAEIMVFLRNPFAGYFKGHIERLDREAQLSIKLTRFNTSSLQYVISCLKLEANQVIERVGVMIGPVSKLGLIPVFVSWFYILYQNPADAKLWASVDWVVYTLTGLYVFLAFPSNSISQKCERYILVLNAAVQLKSGKEDAFSKGCAVSQTES